MPKTERQVPNHLTASHIYGVTEGSDAPTVYFKDGLGKITRFTQRHKNPDNIGYHPARGTHLFFGNVPESMLVTTNSQGQTVDKSWSKVASELKAQGWKTPEGTGRGVLFEVVDTGGGKVSLHRSRGTFREVKDMNEKRKYFAQLQGPNHYRAMDPMTQEFYFTQTAPQ
ncbi:hypothetical protein HH303_02085 [Rhodospirillaceae bacterium KN72]|uniref:Uncharacterized protein n=1 Tax=Pacificispira spongiicola TaxID=2729598 RepID=A0A7Y0DX57_9PROT|nr:hypothetical protein [Pacificispira spongiicola]NMM43249.1 hypothetical protein [Pacificispira spongiicola]